MKKSILGRLDRLEKAMGDAMTLRELTLFIRSVAANNGREAAIQPEATGAKLLAEMPEIALVVCLGAHAMRWHMGDAFPGAVDQAVRSWRAGLLLSPPVIPLPHPSWRNSGWLKRNPWFADELLPELRARVAALLAGNA